MANERLRAAMNRAGVTIPELATFTEHDSKTVSRWLGGRVPHPRTRFKIAKRLKEDESFLWPGADHARVETADSEGLVQFYPHRSNVPSNLWDRLLSQASREVSVLVYVGMFLTERPHMISDLRTKARAGTKIRLAFGDRDSSAVIQRSIDEGIGKNTISAKIDQSLSFFHMLADEPGVSIRIHDTTLYNSIYIFDNDMIVNPHVYGKTAPHAPALHLRRVTSDDAFTSYAESFETVWTSASPAFKKDDRAKD
ncbi:DUF5919 domain-containing protein [Asanoa sp. NPDC049518]|uniref:DUF5919 domain-containing protein n=1 Tax=unclassified Asanoa TaxID=2685164 RepID=UPI003414B1F1